MLSAGVFLFEFFPFSIKFSEVTVKTQVNF